MKDEKLYNKILELIDQLKDDEARSKAFELASDVRIPMQRLWFWTAYMKGLREAYEKMFDALLDVEPKKQRPYIEAERNLCLSCYEACYDYHMGKYEIRYKDHVCDKKGKLVKCTAYFAQRKELLVEVRYDT